MDLLSISSAASSSVSVSGVLATNVTNFVSAKLDGTNYKDWKNQMVAFLVRQGLMGYVNGSISAPPLVTSAEVSDSFLFSLSELIVNPAYTHWRQTDQYVMRALHATLHESVLSDVASFSTSKAVWDALAEMFGGNDKSKDQQLQLLDHLQKMKKELMNDSFSPSQMPICNQARVFQKMKKDLMNDSFSPSQMPICNQDRVRFALDGLEL